MADSKVYLTSITRNHLIHFMTLSDDPELIDTMGWQPFKRNEIERFIQTIEILTLPDGDSRKSITFSIIKKQGNDPIGYVSLKGIDYDIAKAELGIAIMDSRYRSGGYGTEALLLASDYAFNTMQLSVLGLTVFPANMRAIRAYEKVGFKTVDILKKSWTMPNGKKVDMLLMELCPQNLHS